MFQRFAFVLLFVSVFLLAACGGGNDNDAARSEPTAQPALVVDNDVYSRGGDSGSTGQPPASVADSGADGAGGQAGDALLGALNPLQFLGGLDSANISLQADPSLAGMLLTADDLPGDFQSMGEFSFSIPSEFGQMDMAARMFSKGELEGDNFDATVISGALTLPPEALAQVGDLEELQALSDADLAEMEAMTAEMGVEFAELSLLDASGLGDGGFGMHMELDFSALLGAFGAPPDGESLPPGIAMDMYAFFQGDHVLMTMVMWPTDRSPGVDARDLAEIMNARA